MSRAAKTIFRGVKRFKKESKELSSVFKWLRTKKGKRLLKDLDAVIKDAKKANKRRRR